MPYIDQTLSKPRNPATETSCPSCRYIPTHSEFNFYRNHGYHRVWRHRCSFRSKGIIQVLYNL